MNKSFSGYYIYRYLLLPLSVQQSDTTDTKCSLILGLNMNVSNSSSLLSPSGDVDSLLDNDIASILTPDFSSDIMMTSMVSAIPPPATLMGHQNNGSSSRYSLLQGDATSMNDQGRVLQSSAITTTTLEKKNTYKEALAKLDQLGQDMIQKSLVYYLVNILYVLYLYLTML